MFAKPYLRPIRELNLKSAYKQGFVSTARHTILQEIKNPTTLGIWTKLKAAANYNTTSARLNHEIVLLNRGAVVFSIRQMAIELGIARETLRQHLGWLEKHKIIRLQTAREGSIIWLLNYDDVPIRQAIKQEMTHHSQPRGLKSAHPIRNVFSKSYKPYVDHLRGGVSVPDAKETSEYLRTLFEINTNVMPESTKELLRKFKSGT